MLLTTDPLFKNLKTLKLPDIFKINILKFYYKHVRKVLPTYLQGFDFNKRSDIHEHNTRQKDTLQTHKTVTKLAENCVRNAVQNIVNNTNSKIMDKISTHSLQGFAWYIKQYYISNYPEECIIEKCYICKRN